MTDNKKTSKKILPILLILAIAAGLLAKFVIFRGEFLYAGTLEATRVDLSAQLPSAISEVKVHEGDHVESGQEVVDLGCPDFKVASDIANENYARNLRLFKSGSASQEILDQMKSRKEDADVHLSWCTVRSPLKGVVLSRYHEPGEWMNPGTKLLTLANIQDIWAYIYVPQPDVARLHPGMKLTGILPELGKREFDGKILKINDEAEFTPKNVQTQSERARLVFGVKVSFLESNAEEILKPGMTIEIRLPAN